MPVINDSENPTASNSKLNLIQILNTIAFLLKKIRSENSWKIPPNTSIAELAQRQGQQGIKGDKGDPGEPGAKGDKGDPAPLDHQHLSFADVSELQIALNAKAAIDQERGVGCGVWGVGFLRGGKGKGKKGKGGWSQEEGDSQTIDTHWTALFYRSGIPPRYPQMKAVQ